MALIECPECGKNGVSDMAATCPYCGFGIKAHIEKTKKLKEYNAQPTQKAQNDSHSVLGFIALLLIIISLFSMCNSSGSSSLTRGEVRCWYCSKVICNNGRTIHCSQKYSDTGVYTCDYCGKSNVLNYGLLI